MKGRRDGNNIRMVSENLSNHLRRYFNSSQKIFRIVSEDIEANCQTQTTLLFCMKQVAEVHKTSSNVPLKGLFHRK